MGIRVKVTNLAQPNNPPQWYDAGFNATVGDVLATANISTANLVVRVNRAEANTGSALNEGDSIVVSRTDLKGAADEAPVDLDKVATVTLEDIINAGNGKLPERGDGIWGELYDEEAKAKGKALKAVCSSVIRDLKASSAAANRGVLEAEAALKAAKEEAARHAFAGQQLVANINVFPALSVLGAKEDAACYCDRLGIPVPPANSPVWATSAKARAAAEKKLKEQG